MSIAKIVSPQIILLALHASWSSAARPITNVLHGDIGFAAVSGSDAAIFAGDIMREWQTHVVPAQGADYTFLGCDFLQLSQDGTSGTLTPVPTFPVVGTLIGEPNTVNTCVLVRKLSSTKTRGQKAGRLYMPAPLETDVDAVGTVLPARVTAFNTAFEAFRNAVEGLPNFQNTSLALCHFSKTNMPVDPEDGTTVYWQGIATLLTNFETDLQAATQRRRMRR